MEFNNSPDYQGIVNEDNSNKRLFLLLSITSWLLLLVSGWICFFVPDIKFSDYDDDDYYYRYNSYKQLFFWCYQIIRTNKIIDPLPLFIHYILFYIIAVIVLLSVTIALVVYFYYLFIKKDPNASNGMLGNVSQFHFIPLLFVSALFIIGETLDEKKIGFILFPFKGIYYFFNLLFTVFALISLIIISSKTIIQSNSYLTWAVKHGAYSCLIALLMHNLGYIIANYGFYICNIKEKGNDTLKRWLKGTTISFSFLIGLGNLILSIGLKEMIIAVMNILIYIGMIIQFFKLEKNIRKEYYTIAPGIIEAFMIFFSLLVAAFLFIRNKGPSNNSI